MKHSLNTDVRSGRPVRVPSVFHPWPQSLLAALLSISMIGTASAAELPTYDGRTITQWQASLSDADAKVRRKAAYALGQLGPTARPAVPALAAALADRQLEVAWYVADTLGRIGPEAAPAVEPLVGVIQESPGDKALRRTAVIALGRIGPGAKEARPAIEKLLASDDAETRVAAAVALYRITGGDAALSALLAELKLTGGSGPMAASLAVGELGLQSDAAARALVAVLDSPDADVRRAAIESLGQFETAAVEPLLAVLNRNGPNAHTQQARVAAVEALGGIADIACQKCGANGLKVQNAADGARVELVRERVVPAFAEHLSNQDDDVRAATGRAIVKAGSMAVPGLVAAMLKPDSRTSAAAQMAIGRLKPYLPVQTAPDLDSKFIEEFLPALTKALQHRDPDIRAASFRLFAELGIGKSGASAATALRAGLSDPNSEIRRHAAAALARMER